MQSSVCWAGSAASRMGQLPPVANFGWKGLWKGQSLKLPTIPVSCRAGQSVAEYPALQSLSWPAVCVACGLREGECSCHEPSRRRSPVTNVKGRSTPSPVGFYKEKISGNIFSFPLDFNTSWMALFCAHPCFERMMYSSIDVATEILLNAMYFIFIVHVSQ